LRNTIDATQPVISAINAVTNGESPRCRADQSRPALTRTDLRTTLTRSSQLRHGTPESANL
jgi:hypothetical protein